MAPTEGGEPKKTQLDPVTTEAHIPMLEAATQDATRVPASALSTADGRAAFRAVVAEYGFAVVTDVLSSDDVARAEELWSADLRGIIERRAEADDGGDGGKRDKLSGVVAGAEARTYPTDRAALGARFVTDFGLPQGRMPWFVRRHERVVDVYAALHEAEPEMVADPRALCVGTDSIFYSTDALAADADPSTLDDFLWPHIDQNSEMLPHGKWNTYQSIVYVWPATERSKSTVILPRGNGAEAHQKYLSDAPPRSGHFVAVLPKHFGDFAQAARRIPVPAGGMVVWSCSTLHQGWSHGDRLAVPVCWEPRWRRPNDALARKRLAVKRGLPTTHWASIGLSHGKPFLKPKKVDDVNLLHHRAHHHALRLKPGCADSTLDDESDVEIDESIDRCL